MLFMDYVFGNPSNTPISCDYPWEHNLRDSIATQLTIRWLTFCNSMTHLPAAAPIFSLYLFILYTSSHILYIYMGILLYIYLKKKLKQLCGAEQGKNGNIFADCSRLEIIRHLHSMVKRNLSLGYTYRLAYAYHIPNRVQNRVTI